ncbi:nuclear transport factor 2 family protein [Propionimicrobium sp. PCR01-08-3]|uniref:nuclear transport factor 2 family protein n=1 Tax=Propionimicrobium sp. PCR01-08-3 TaxID=3052086 RepID=UPI00255C9BA9|nr:nuclear transport factor 2 family protein [Propionimicrobium sp. PCR01-08-3]WIY82681.1 nuclear transport factor 2 family protein [Propionimicrobium sp. PCR01-08-3]
MQTDREAIEANYRDQLGALVDKDFDKLDELLTAGFTRTHITGKVQTKGQWLSQLRSDQMVYHSFDFLDTSVTAEKTTATLVGKVLSDATLYGEHQQWHLQIRQTFLKSDGVWKASSSVVTQW